MAFQINTNIMSLNAHKDGVMISRDVANSLEKLSSGQRINKAADDASGLMIADGLKNQANSLGQSIRNVNDAIGIVQIADKAMDEQVKITDMIKIKATQSAQDAQTTETRKALQADIVRLLEELDNIAFTTSFNGKNLLAGAFTDKEFQIGAYSNETVKTSIPATYANKIGETRFETGELMRNAGKVQFTFSSVDGTNDIAIESVVISNSPGTGIKVLADTINKNSDKLHGVKASWNLLETAQDVVKSGSVTGLKLNGILIGDLYEIKENDSDGKLVNSINKATADTGIEAYIDNRGRLNLRSLDGRGIQIQADSGLSSVASLSASAVENYGRLTLSRIGGKDIRVSTTSASSTMAAGFSSNVAETIMNLAKLRGTFTKDQASAIGAFQNSEVENVNYPMGSGVTTLSGAMAIMTLADNAQKFLDTVRSDLGSVQNQLISTVNNISVTQVNAKSSESAIRDVDFAQEVANFERGSLLSQSGSFAMSQANQVSKNVMQLLKD